MRSASQRFRNGPRENRGTRAVWLALVAFGLVAENGAAQEWRTDFSKRSVELSEIVSGGPPKDGIPSIDKPRFIAPAQATWLTRREPVLVVRRPSEIKVYPLQILMWHEIVNDEVGGLPVAVTYCPLCNTALVFDRRHGEGLLDFGTTGRLRHSDLVMYDRQTETWWQQATGEAIVGTLAGDRLVPVDAQLTSWAEALDRFPNARVLSRETGFDRPYGRNPYQGYDSGNPLLAFLSKAPDRRLPPMERVVAIELDGDAAAFPLNRLRKERLIQDVVGSRPIVIVWMPGAASAVDGSTLDAGRDVGSVGVFDRRLGSETLQFESAGDRTFRDRRTGTEWNLFGEAISGRLTGQTLVPVVHGSPFWFAWAAFRPGISLRR